MLTDFSVWKTDKVSGDLSRGCIFCCHSRTETLVNCYVNSFMVICIKNGNSHYARGQLRHFSRQHFVIVKG